MLLDNPFHVLGLPADCTVAERTRRESKANAYLHMGMALKFKDDLYFDGCRRNEATTRKAAADLHDAKQRIKYGLFWFTQSGILDHRALQMVRRADLRTAFDSLKTVENRQVTPAYASSISNFGTVCMLVGIRSQLGWANDVVTRSEYLLRGLRAKARVLGTLAENDLKAHCAALGDDVAAGDANRLMDLFAEGLKTFVSEADKYGVVLPTDGLMKALDAGGDRYEPLKLQFASKPRKELERAVKMCNQVSGKDARQACSAALELVEIAKEHLPQLEKVMSKEDIRYRSVADSVSGAVLDAAVDYFNYHQEHDSASLRVYDDALELNEFALGVARDILARERAEESLATLKKMKKAAEHERMVSAMAQWAEGSSAILEREMTSARRLEYVSECLDASNSTSGIARLSHYRDRGVGLSGVGFSISEPMVSMASVVGHLLVSHIVAACNENDAMFRIHRGGQLLRQLARTFVPLSSTFDHPLTRPGSAKATGPFYVNRQCRERIETNLQIVEENAVVPSPPPSVATDSSGCFARLSIVAIIIIVVFFAALLSG